MAFKVLLVDDDDLYRDSIKISFKNNDYEFIESKYPRDAIEIIQNDNNIQVIILDMQFKDVPDDGISVLDFLVTDPLKRKVIVLTGHDELLAADVARKYKVFNYLTKSDKRNVQSIRFSVNQAFNDWKTYALLEIQERINSGDDLQNILDMISQSIIDLTGAYTCHFRIYNTEYGDYWLIGSKGFPGVEAAFQKRKLLGQKFAGMAAEAKDNNGKTILNLQNEEEFQREANEILSQADEPSHELKKYFNTVQVAYIRAVETGVIENEIDLILNVNSQRKDFFDSEEKVSTINEFLELATIAVTKDRMEKRKREIHKEYGNLSTLLSKVTQELHGGVNLDNVFEIVLKVVSEMIKPELLSIFLYNERLDCLVNVAEYESGVYRNDINEPVHSSQGLTGKVFAERKSIRAPQIEKLLLNGPYQAPGFDDALGADLKRRLHSNKLDHFLGVPILRSGEAIGVLRAVNKKSGYYDDPINTKADKKCLLRRGFSKECQWELEIAANHLSVAEQNSRLVLELREKLTQLEKIHSIALKLTKETDLKRLLREIVETASAVMGADICMLFLLDRERNQINLDECYGMPAIPEVYYKRGEGKTGQVLNTGEPIYEPRTELGYLGKYDDEIRTYLRKKHNDTLKEIESFMAVPILGKGIILGVIKVINKMEYNLHFTETDLKLFQIFASVIGIAIENAEKYEIANRKLAEAEKSTELSLLAGCLAHEINNSSGLIPANITVIRQKLEKGNDESGRILKSIKSELSTIETSAQQAVSLAKELEGFSPTKIGKRMKLDINDLISQAIEQSKPILYKEKSHKKLEIKLGLTKGPLLCSVFMLPFIGIVRNLVFNAFQAMESKKVGVLTIRTHKDHTNRKVKIEFIDTGCGIKEEDRDKIYKPDFTTKQKGTGLGLWFTKTHLTHIDAIIDFTSQIGLGTTFTIELPLSEPNK